MATPSIPLLVLTSTFPRHSGDSGPRFVLDLAKRMAARFDVVVLAPHARGLAREERIEGVRVVRFRYLPARFERLAYGGGITENLRNRPWLYLTVPFFLLSQIFAVRRMIRRERIAVIHAHWWLPQALSAILAGRLCRCRVPVVCTLHGADVFAFGHGSIRRLMTWTLRRCHTVCAVSRAVRDALPPLPRNRPPVALAPMGVDLRGLFHAQVHANDEREDIVFVGRLVEKKGVEWLLQAFALAAHTLPSLKLHVVGDGPRSGALKTLAETLGVADRVVFHGTLAHGAVAKLLQSSAVAVMPSISAISGDREGLGLTAIEAAGCGCALIVSDAPCFRDVVSGGESAVVVPHLDRAALCEAILRLSGDHELRARYASAARRFVVEQFDWEDVARRYDVILAGAGAGTSVAAAGRAPPDEPHVWFPAIRTGSGADRFTERLAAGLRASGIAADISWLPHRAEYLPHTVARPGPPAGTNLVHINSWLHRRFVPRRLPVVVSALHVVHEPSFAPYQSPAQRAYHRYWIRPIEERNLQRAAGLATISDHSATSLQTCFGARSDAVIPLWVDTERFRPAAREAGSAPFRLLFVGQHSTRKGFDLLPEIMARLGEGFCLKVTPGETTGRAMRAWPPNMSVLGEDSRLSDDALIRAYQQADVLLFPSRLEGFGQVLLEAMACGTPPVATRGSAIAEVVKSAQTGLLCDQDDVCGFVEAVRYLRFSPPALKQMQVAARRSAVADFGEDVAIAAYVDFYRRVLAERARYG